jgi:hypothetical protein
MSFGLGLRSTPFLVNTTPDIPIVDNFNRADGALGITSDGNGLWEILSGNFAIASNRAVSVPSNATSGLAVVNNFSSDVTISLDVSSGGDALYFRVVDANNWWRVLVNSVTTTSFFETGYTEYLWTSSRSGAEYRPTLSESSAGCIQTYHDHNSPFSLNFVVYWPPIEIWGFSPNVPPSGVYGAFTHTHPITLAGCGRSVTFSHTHYGSSAWTGQLRFVSTGGGASTVTTVTMQLQRSVNGTITTIGTSSGSTSSVQVTASGSNISVRRNGSTSNSLTTASDTHLNATRHGIGRGPSSNLSTAIDNFSCIPIPRT